MTKRTFAFARRVFLELTRDPLSYLFALGMPLTMLGIMTLVNRSLPPEASMTLFSPTSLTPGVAVFGMTFLMLFGAILVSGDRESGFLTRLSTTPLRAGEVLLGYLSPLLFLTVVQAVLTYLTGAILAWVQNTPFSAGYCVLSVALSIPTMLFFLALGFIFGNLCGTRAAPGIASMLITVASLLGGIWMDVDMMGGTWLKICRVFPFYHAVKIARDAMTGTVATESVGIVAVWTGVILALGCSIFLLKRKK